MSTPVLFAMPAVMAYRSGMLIAALMSAAAFGCAAADNDPDIRTGMPIVALPTIFVEEDRFSADTTKLDKVVFSEDRVIFRVDFESRTAPAPATIIVKLLKEDTNRKMLKIVNNKAGDVKLDGKKGSIIQEWVIPKQPGEYQVEVFRPAFSAKEVPKSIRFHLTVKPKR